MFGGVIWVIAIVTTWLLLFVATLTFARYIARDHDKDLAMVMPSEMGELDLPQE
ncbi:MAG TPA: hypothetical protein VKQ30_05175 [Ktedonobacterales bacterium]|nr:hypothetical protein [Ktedonobacterales bacterium]